MKHIPFNESTLKPSVTYDGKTFYPYRNFIQAIGDIVCTDDRHFYNVPPAIYEDECCRERLDDKYLLYVDGNVYIQDYVVQESATLLAKCAVSNYHYRQSQNGSELPYRIPRNLLPLPKDG